jgi:opacity protein-like surface antigen
MKRMSVWCLALLAVLLLVGLVQAAPYVQGELGVNFGTASGAKVNGVTAPNPTLNTGLLGGVRAGFDFNDPNLRVPRWAKYFEVAIGYDYLGQGISNRGDYTTTNNTVFNQTLYFTSGVGAKARQVPFTSSYLATKTNNPFGGSSGSQSLLSFLGIAKFPFTVAGHVWVPYVGVGPGVAWTSIGNHTATNAALVVEPGVRYLINKNWFVSAAYRYTNTAPTIAGVDFHVNNNALVGSVGYHW